MQAALRPSRVSTLGLFGLAVVATAAVILFLRTSDSTVTSWHVPYEVVRGSTAYPLYDHNHCYTRAEIQSPLRRIGAASGLPLFAPPGTDPSVFYVQPKNHECFMWYLSLSDVG
jgi:hypothetical protein